jgi:hypothetical protein
MYALRATHAANAAGLCAARWYAPRELAVVGASEAINTDAAGVYDIYDKITREHLDQLTITPYADTLGRHRVLTAADLTRKLCVTLDDASAATLRALGEGNLSLGIRRAAELIGGGA